MCEQGTFKLFLGEFLRVRTLDNFSAETSLSFELTAGRSSSKMPSSRCVGHSQTPTFRYLEDFNIKSSGVSGQEASRFSCAGKKIFDEVSKVLSWINHTFLTHWCHCLFGCNSLFLPFVFSHQSFGRL